eukprot:6172093-Pleurochrysis_carterae.AAC.2
MRSRAVKGRDILAVALVEMFHSKKPAESNTLPFTLKKAGSAIQTGRTFTGSNTKFGPALQHCN